MNSTRQTDVASEVQPCGGTILLVEDEHVIRKLVTRILTKNGYRVLEAISGEQALAAVAGTEETISLVLTDLRMPGMDGNELVRRLQCANPSLRALYMSGGRQGSEVSTTDDTDFLQKPFRPNALMAKVRQLLSRP